MHSHSEIGSQEPCPASDSSSHRSPRAGKPAHFGKLAILAISPFLLLACVAAFAQEASPDQYQDSQPPYADSQQPARQPLNAGQLEQLVAPIALYPDALVAQVLVASTYPAQVMEADRWRQQQAYATPDQIAYGADAQPWDPSVKALAAFPQVLAQLDRNLQWTTDLGNAYYNQPQDVLEAVQIMRKAMAGRGISPQHAAASCALRRAQR